MIGRDYWPSAEDEQRLPYVRAIIKEVRCRPQTTESEFEFESRRFRLAFLTLSYFPLGRASALAVLAGDAALLDRGLCVQRDVHTEEHGPYSQLLRDTSQRREISGRVSSSLVSISPDRSDG